MTNSSPPDPQNPIPERRQRPASGVTFDEMIAIIVRFFYHWSNIILVYWQS